MRSSVAIAAGLARTSPAANPAMWTQPLFSNLFQLLAPDRPCSLPTYSRSTMLRASLLLAGFYVGAGHATGEKEETTIAANTLELVDESTRHRRIPFHRVPEVYPNGRIIWQQPA